MIVLEADLTWTGERFEAGIQVRCRGDRITDVGRLGRRPDRRLAGRALLPGFVNAHSHAFQRALRGRGEKGGGGERWRGAVWGLADGLGIDDYRRICRATFEEMRSVGITTVGEFHPLRHSSGGEDFLLDEVLLGAAAESGIRVLLLPAYRSMGGAGKPISPSHARFRSSSPEAYWRQMERLIPLGRIGVGLDGVGVASPEEIRDLAAEARRRGMVLQVRLDQWIAEIDDSVAVHGKRPMRLLLDQITVDGRVTAVHGTHTDTAQMAEYRNRGGRVCLAPLTAASFGQTLSPAAMEGPVSLGTDSNGRISMLEEVRWLDYARRASRGEREALDAKSLLDAATVEGAAALGIPAGRIAPDCWADFVAIDLGAAALEGWNPQSLLPAILFGSGERVFAEVCVGGRWSEP